MIKQTNIQYSTSTLAVLLMSTWEQRWLSRWWNREGAHITQSNTVIDCWKYSQVQILSELYNIKPTLWEFPEMHPNRLHPRGIYSFRFSLAQFLFLLFFLSIELLLLFSFIPFGFKINLLIDYSYYTILPYYYLY